MKNYYAILGVSPHASQEEIRRAYLTLVKKYHPDQNPNDPLTHEKFLLIQEAYEVLSDPQKHLAYQLQLLTYLSFLSKSSPLPSQVLQAMHTKASPKSAPWKRPKSPQKPESTSKFKSFTAKLSSLSNPYLIGFLFLLSSVFLVYSLKTSVQSFYKADYRGTYKMDLSYRHLKTFPIIEPKEAVFILDLSHNHLKRLPVEMHQFQNLVALDLSYNDFTEFPEGLRTLPNLKRLSLAKNQITHLPYSPLSQMKSLLYLDIRGNPIPKQEIQTVKELLPHLIILSDK